MALFHLMWYDFKIKQDNFLQITEKKNLVIPNVTQYNSQFYQHLQIIWF